MKEVVLSNGLVAKVDDADYERVTSYNWYPKTDKRSKTSYAQTNVCYDGKRTTLRMHKLILNAPQDKEVDHIDNNGLNNQRHNLRLATRSQNCANLSKQNRSKSSQFKGVSWDKKKGFWRAQIQIDGAKKHVGYFSIESQAALAYNLAAVAAFGSFANLNEV